MDDGIDADLAHGSGVFADHGDGFFGDDLGLPSRLNQSVSQKAADSGSRTWAGSTVSVR